MKNYKEILTENRQWAEETFEKIDKKFSEVTLRCRDKLADNIDENGRRLSVKPNAWTSGFWGGLNVLLYEKTKNEDYLLTARRSEELLDEALADFKGLYHDVGFMWHILSGALYRLTGNEGSKERNLHAASSLFSRFVLGGNYIRAWNGPDDMNWTIIDCLMNLPILYWASEIIGDDRFKRIAMAHADNAIDCHIRPDGSVVHIVEHDRETGECVQTYAGQGYAVGSSWSRGQSWAIYGFTLSYIHTKEERYLNAAKRVANYFIANCCDDWLPRVDFRAPSTPVYYDSTAGCCAACGLLELARLLPENEGGMYANAAINLLKAIGENFGRFDTDVDYLIGNGTVRYPIPDQLTLEQAGVHTPIIYGDYYFTEAILKLLGSEFNPW